MNRVVPLSELAHVGLGFKSLQNDFFYVTAETIKTYGIEKHFLEPIFKLADFQADVYVQSVQPSLWVFCCDQAESSIKGTGALKYIRACAERAASEKKQSSGRALTIREVLEKQSGRYWYSPKAQRVSSRIWMRKGIGTVAAPILSNTGIVVDQRCNYITPSDGVAHEELAALLASSVFAYSVEINGSTSMGAGVLEAPTTKLREYPVPNLLAWGRAERDTLKTLGAKVFKSSSPQDWALDSAPAQELCALDAHVLKCVNPVVTTTTLYEDLRSAVQSRLRMSASRSINRKRTQTENVAGLADEIAKRLRELIEIKPFPEGFVDGGAPTESIDLRGSPVIMLECHPMMGQAELVITQADGSSSLHVPEAVAELITRTVLFGRRQFIYPLSAEDARQTTENAALWVGSVKNRLDKAVAESAAGSGYESELAARVLQILGINQQAFLGVVSENGK